VGLFSVPYYILAVRKQLIQLKPRKKKPQMAQLLGSEQNVETTMPSYQLRLDTAMVSTATKLLPLLALLDTVQTQVASESVFHARRKKIQMHLAVAYAELRTERPRRLALAHTFQVLSDLVREETQDISPDELKQAAKEVVLATLKNAPALVNVAHQARLLA
jgi:hypothetical protein